MYCRGGWENTKFWILFKNKSAQDFIYLVSQPRKRIQVALLRRPKSAAMWGHLPSLSCYVSSLCTHEFELFSLPLLSLLPPAGIGNVTTYRVFSSPPRGFEWAAKSAAKKPKSMIDQETADGTDTSGVRLRPCNANEVLLSISEGGRE